MSCRTTLQQIEQTFTQGLGLKHLILAVFVVYAEKCAWRGHRRVVGSVSAVAGNAMSALGLGRVSSVTPFCMDLTKMIYADASNFANSLSLQCKPTSQPPQLLHVHIPS